MVYRIRRASASRTTSQPAIQRAGRAVGRQVGQCLQYRCTVRYPVDGRTNVSRLSSRSDARTRTSVSRVPLFPAANATVVVTKVYVRGARRRPIWRSRNPLDVATGESNKYARHAHRHIIHNSYRFWRRPRTAADQPAPPTVPDRRQLLPRPRRRRRRFDSNNIYSVIAVPTPVTRRRPHPVSYNNIIMFADASLSPPPTRYN